MGNMHVKMWGVRGSIPVPGPDTVRYGGNTSCLELYSDEGDRLIFDAGTGIRNLGLSLDLSKSNSLYLFISHPHWDHISGLPFFPVIFIPGNSVTIFGPRTHEYSLEEILKGQMQYTYFPVRMAELSADINYMELKDGDFFNLGNLQISVAKLNHPVECLGYRVKYNDTVFVYLADNEPYYNIYNDDDPDTERLVRDMNLKVAEFVKGSNCLVADTQYLPSEYSAKKGWGHSTTTHVINMALKNKVAHLIFFHHDPLRSDDELDLIIEHYRKRVAEKGYSMKIDAAREGEVIDF